MRNDLDASILKSGFPASDELLAFAMKGCFRAKLNGVVAQRSKDVLCFCPHEISEDSVVYYDAHHCRWRKRRSGTHPYLGLGVFPFVFSLVHVAEAVYKKLIKINNNKIEKI